MCPSRFTPGIPAVLAVGVRLWGLLAGVLVLRPGRTDALMASLPRPLAWYCQIAIAVAVEVCGCRHKTPSPVPPAGLDHVPSVRLVGPTGIRLLSSSSRLVKELNIDMREPTETRGNQSWKGPRHGREGGSRGGATEQALKITSQHAPTPPEPPRRRGRLLEQ